MKWSLRMGRILGIDVYIHVTFLLLLGFVAVAHWLTDGSLEAAIGGAVFFLSLFGCVLLHEYGHALAARRYGIQTRDITLLPIGGVARLERMPDKPLQELWVAIAGPLVNVMIAAGLFIGLLLAGNWQPLSSLSTTHGSLAERLLLVNVFLVLFNLLPAFPMDGGRVLRALLALRMNYVRATSIAATVGKGMALLFGLLGIFTNPMLVFIAFFVWIGATQEAAATRLKSSVAGFLVSDAMQTEFKTLSPEDTLARAVALILAGSQRDFPVTSDGRVLGILTQGELFEALQEKGEQARVESAMKREVEIFEANESLERAVTRMAPRGANTHLVLRNGELVGLFTAENLSGFFMIRSALDRRVPPVLPRAPAQPPPIPAAARFPAPAPGHRLVEGAR